MKNYAKSILKAGTILKAAIMDRRPNLYYVGGWLGKDNLGDEALFSAYHNLFPRFSFIHYDGGRLGAGIARKLSSSRAGILAGGTLIGQRRNWLDIASSFLEICPSLLVFGTGVDDPSLWSGETTIEDWIPILERCDYIGVRGPQSADLLQSHGLTQVEIVGDPVLTFAADHVNPSPVPRTLGLNIGTADGRLWGSEDRVCEEMARLAKTATKAGWSVKWFAVWPKDLEITRKAASAGGSGHEICPIFRNHREFMAQVRSLTAFVGMKLHATILATCALTPAIMLEYQPKCRDYMKSIGREDTTFRTDMFRADEIWDLVNRFNDHYHEASLALSRGIHALQKRQSDFAAKLTADLLNRDSSL